MRPRLQRLVGELLRQSDAQLLALQQYSPQLGFVPMSAMQRAQLRQAFEARGRQLPVFQVGEGGGPLGWAAAGCGPCEVKL